MLNRFGWSGGWSGDDDVDVRLEFVDAADVTVRTFEGTGTLSGDCCKTLLLRLSDDGEYAHRRIAITAVMRSLTVRRYLHRSAPQARR